MWKKSQRGERYRLQETLSYQTGVCLVFGRSWRCGRGGSLLPMPWPVQLGKHPSHSDDGDGET